MSFFRSDSLHHKQQHVFCKRSQEYFWEHGGKTTLPTTISDLLTVPYTSRAQTGEPPLWTCDICLCPIVFCLFFFHSDSVCVVTEKSRAFSPHSEAKKQALGPDDLRTSSLGRPVLSPYPMSPRDMAKISHEQHLLHLNCEFSPLLSGFISLVLLFALQASLWYCILELVSQNQNTSAPLHLKIKWSYLHLMLSPTAFQQGGHPSLSGLPQDSSRLAAVRPLTMPEPPPLISSSKPGGSITQVYRYKISVSSSHS